MKEALEFIGFGNLLTMLLVLFNMIWHYSKVSHRIDKLEEKTNEQKVKHIQNDTEKKTILSELQKIREWQIERDAQNNVIAIFEKSNQNLVEAIKSLRK